MHIMYTKLRYRGTTKTYFAHIGTVIRLNIFITKFFMDYFLFMVANLQRDRLFSVAKY